MLLFDRDSPDSCRDYETLDLAGYVTVTQRILECRTVPNRITVPLGARFLKQAQNRPLVDATMPPITRGRGRAREIWIDDALCRTARCRRVALRQRRVAAFVIVGPPGVYVQANRIIRIVRLGPSRCRRQNHRNVKIAKAGMRIRASFGICAAQRTAQKCALIADRARSATRWLRGMSVIDPAPASGVPNDDPCVMGRTRARRDGSAHASPLSARTSSARCAPRP